MNLTIPLDNDLSAFVVSQVESGRFATNDDVVRGALHLLRSMDDVTLYSSEELRAAWQEGLDSGDAGEIDFKELQREARAGLDR